MASSPSHVASSMAAREIAAARQQMKAARGRATRLNALGRAIDRELKKLPPADVKPVLEALQDSISAKLGELDSEQ
jgi:hypothetical protein